MLQAVIMGIGVLILLMKKVKVTDSRYITRPKSIYLGLILVAFGITLHFFPFGTLESGMNSVYYTAFFFSLFSIASYFMIHSEQLDPKEVIHSPPDTKRNLFILLGFLVILALASFVYLKLA